MLALMVSTVDTNLIARSNRETQLQVTEEIKEILKVPDTTWNYFTSAEAQKIIAAIQNSDNVIHY